MDYLIFASYGNDSIALIQWAHENIHEKKISVLHSNTGWAHPKWENRVKKGELFAQSFGMDTHQTKCEGMESMIKRKKGWPQGGAAAFCTSILKVLPALEFMDEFDPDVTLTCMTGIRREESQNRKNMPEFIEESERHGGRKLWSPMVEFSESDRNELITRAGFEILPHRSRECYPCVHANRNDLWDLEEDTIQNIERIEGELGIGVRSGKPKWMFRPKRHKGAQGIREVVMWAKDSLHKTEDQVELFPCTSGYCGM